MTFKKQTQKNAPAFFRVFEIVLDRHPDVDTY